MSTNKYISIVIPVYNDPKGLKQTLNSLVSQQNAPNYEVRVVDNDSTDETPNVIRTFESEYPELVFGHSETDIQSSYAARNTGIEYSKGDIIVFLDANETVEETFVVDVLQQFRESNIDYLGFNVNIYIPEGEVTLWAKYDIAMGLPVEHYLQTKKFAPTCALAVRRAVFEELGDFAETLISGGDKEFGQRVHNAGLSVEFASGIIIKHPARTQFHELKKKAKRIGRGKAQILMMSDPESVPISLICFLPPNPIRVKNRSRNTDYFVVIYFIEYIIKIFQLYGRIYEYIRKTQNSID